MMKVTTNTMSGIYHSARTKRLKRALAVAIISAVIDDKSRGDRFLVLSTDDIAV
jgi:hypothetical protein